MKPPTPSALARIAAGLTPEAVQKRARVSVAYLRACERSQRFRYPLACRLSRLYGCSLNVFLPQPGAGARQPRRRSVTAAGARRRGGR